MNYKIVGYVLGKVMLIEAALIAVSYGVALIYGETFLSVSFLAPILCLVLLWWGFGVKKPENIDFYAKEGFLITALAWILMSAIGALPFIISGYIPSFIDAFFETVSGFTTTGASIITDVEIFPKGLIFWRSFTHWIGGMGVLLFLLAVVPRIGKRSMHIMRAEVPGPDVGKVSSRASDSARIMYILYLGLTVLEMLFLYLGGMPLFDSAINAFSTAGTGGFSNYNNSIGAYGNSYFEIVIACFMFLFGVNFNIYYLIVIKKFREALCSEELRVYFGIIIASVAMVTLSILRLYASFGEALRMAFFHVGTVMTTTGFNTTDVNAWPTFAKTILLTLMFVGGCSGSTAGGLKVARIMILYKNAKRELQKLVHPHAIRTVRFEGKPLDEKVAKGTNLYMIVFIFLFAGSILLFSLNGNDLTTSFAVVTSCINNIGLMIGQLGNLSTVAAPLKVMLSFDMLVGRLEIFPVVIFFMPSLWASGRRKK